MGNDGMIEACPVAGCPPAGPIVVSSAEVAPFNLALDETFIYWSSDLGGTIRRAFRP